MKKLYRETAKTIDEQIAIMQTRGIVINNEAKAKKYLSNIGYYRMGFYIHPFEVTSLRLGRNKRHEVRPGTKIEEIVALYYYDFDLRTILNRYLSIIEVSIRSTIIYELSIKYKYDTTWFVSPNVMKSDFIASFNREVYVHLRGKPNIKHHHDIYYGNYAPAWKTIEFMTIGNLEVLYSKLRWDADKKLISKRYNELAIATFKSYLSAVREVRNACAHSSVLFNLRLSSGILSGAACPYFVPGSAENQIFAGALRVIDYMIRQISVNRANEMWKELYMVTKRLYSIVPSIRQYIERNTGIFLPSETK